MIKKEKYNVQLQFEQSIKHEEYLRHLYEIFKNYSKKEPKIINRYIKANKKLYQSIRFTTSRLEVFNKIYNNFHDENKKKIVPLNIGDVLKPIGLAYWAMDDGYKQQKAFVLCTDSFKKEEVELLIKVIKRNFDIDSTLY